MCSPGESWPIVLGDSVVQFEFLSEVRSMTTSIKEEIFDNSTLDNSTLGNILSQTHRILL